ncbi:MAG: penicillin-binding protein 2 [Candidatus Saccharimonadales bacterium]
MQQTPDTAPVVSVIQRARTWFGLLVVIFAIFTIRAFYLQVIRYDYYKKAALSDQLREYAITAPRGTITAHEGSALVPLVLNQKLYTLYADPTLVKNTSEAAYKVAGVIGGDAASLNKKISATHTRYVILAKRISAEQSQKILSYKLPGIGTQEQDYRTYPQGSLASQLLGFVSDDGAGVYGLEQALNSRLKGKDGQLKAVTDVHGIPLAASTDNISTPPKPGDNLTLTIDLGMQAQLENILKTAQEKNKSKDVSAVIMDVHTGAVKAMANYPTFDPASYQKVEDPGLFQNDVVTQAIETGSIMKVLTTATGLNTGAINAGSSFYDPGKWQIDGATISDVAEDHSTGQQTVESTLNLSLNTGATWILMQLGGGQINQKARETLHDYFVNHFQLGQPTGIEQGYESAGTIHGPKDTGSAINLTYANMSFGQAMTATALQMDAAFSSVLNGGTYYRPYLVESVTSADGKVTPTQPKVVKDNVVSGKVSSDIVALLERVNQEHIAEGFSYLNFGSNYKVGGKTGSAQLALPGGGYSTTDFNATYIGFVGGDTPQYAIAVYNMQPHISYGFAGAQAAQPIFADLAHMLINDFGVTPKSH